MTRGEILLRRELKREMGSTEPLLEEEIERLEENNKRLKEKNKKLQEAIKTYKELESKNKILSDFAKHIYTTYGYDSKLNTWTSWGLKYDLDTYFDDIDYATNFELNDEEIFRNKGE